MNMETGYELNVPVGDGNKDVKAIISNNEVIWERAIPTPKSGVAPLSFRATRAKPLLDWSVTGKTYQAWTPSPEPQIGNNKFDNSKIEKSATVTNFAYTDSSVSFGSMTVGSVINSAEIKAEDASYAFSFMGDTNKVTFALRCYDSSRTYLGDANKIFDEASRAVMTTLANTVYVRLYITSTVQGNVLLTNLMLNKGNTVMTFEPFGYLPNTGACPVQGVGDYDAVTEEYKIPIAIRGKNYLSSELEIGTLSASEGLPVIMYTRLRTIDFTVLNSGTYTIDAKAFSGEDLYGIAFEYDVNTEAFIKRTSDNWMKLPFSFTIDSQRKIKFIIAKTEGGTDKIYLNEIKFSGIFDEDATKTSIYLPSPLMKNETLISNGTKENKYYKIVLDGTEDWITNSAQTLFVYIFNTPLALHSGSHAIASDVYCSHFVSEPYDDISDATSKPYGITLGYSTGDRFCIRYKDMNANISDFKLWLKSQYDNGTPVTVWYRLAEPTSETIEIPEITIFKGNNVIDIDTEVQPSNVSITYLSSGFEPQPLKTADGQILYTNNNQPLNTLE